MQDSGQEAKVAKGFSNEDGRSLLELAQSVDEHVSAIQDAAQALMMRKPKASAAVPKAVWIVVKASSEKTATTVETKPVPVADEAPGSSCHTYSFPCGKGPHGYIMCTVTYCKESGPVTL